MTDSFTHKGKRNLLIWDGLDDGITDETYKVSCPHCNSLEFYNVRDITNIEDLPNEVSEHLNREKIIFNGIYGYEIKKGIPAYGLHHACKNCNKELWIIAGLKEIQPQRYNIYYKSTVYSLPQTN